MALRKWLGIALVVIAGFQLSACDGENAAAGGTTTVTVNGTAATGAAFVGVIEAVNLNGDVFGPVAIAADGSFAIDLDEGGPYLLRAYDPDDPAAGELFSIALNGGVYNLTPLTTLMVALTLQDIAAAGAPDSQQADVLADFQVLADQWAELAGAVWAELATFVNEGAVNNAIAVINANLLDGNVGGGAVDWASYDFLRNAFAADGNGFDGILDDLQVIVDIVDNAGVSEVAIDILNGAGQQLFVFDLQISLDGVVVGGGGGGVNGDIAGTWKLTVNGTSGGVALPETVQTAIPANQVPISEATAVTIAEGFAGGNFQGQDVSINFSNLSVTYTPNVNGQVGDTITVDYSVTISGTVSGQAIPQTSVVMNLVWQRTG